MQSDNINYVIATWTGTRRGGNDQYHKDPTFYLKHHLCYLNRVKHNLKQVTIVIPYNKKEPETFTSYVESIPETLECGTKIVIIRRENYGQSYGSWAHVYENYRLEFDYYIFIEDDYAPIQDCFDDILTSHFNALPKCGYLCSLVLEHDSRLHAAISNGITSSAILEKIFKAYETLPHGGQHRKGRQNTYSPMPQLEWSWAFLDQGYELHDLSQEFRAPFNEAGALKFYGQGKDLFIPLQFIGGLDHLYQQNSQVV